MRVRRRRVVVERPVVGAVGGLVAVVVRAGGGTANAANRDADRVYRVAQTLVRRRRLGELALELVRCKGAGRLRSTGRLSEGGRRPVATLEPAPRQARGIQQVADVL